MKNQIEERGSINPDLMNVDGTYNDYCLELLTPAIYNMAKRASRTNTNIDYEDLIQEAWCNIFSAARKRTINYAYALCIAKTTAIGRCRCDQRKLNHIDTYKSSVLNSNTYQGDKEGIADVVEYEISNKNNTCEADRVCLKVDLEALLDKADPLVKNFIIIKYIKEFNGDSPKIIEMYNQLYEAVDETKKRILDNMTKYTAKQAWSVLGIRNTDNCTTRIKGQIRELLCQLV